MATREILPATVNTLDYIPNQFHGWYERGFTGSYRLVRVSADSPEATAYPVEVGNGTIEVMQGEDDPYNGAVLRALAMKEQSKDFFREVEADIAQRQAASGGVVVPAGDNEFADFFRAVDRAEKVKPTEGPRQSIAFDPTPLV